MYIIYMCYYKFSFSLNMEIKFSGKKILKILLSYFFELLNKNLILLNFSLKPVSRTENYLIDVYINKVLN
jgi:hypothetical protein